MNIAPWMAPLAARAVATRLAPSAARALATRLPQTIARARAARLAQTAARAIAERMAPSAPRALATRLAQTVVRVAAPWMPPPTARARAAWITPPTARASIAGFAPAFLHFRERSSRSGLLRAPALLHFRARPSRSGLLRAPARLHRRRARVFRRVGPALFFLLLPVTLFADLVVHTIDVGQGDATFLRHEEHTILVDAGPDNARARRYLQSINIDNIDIAIATHAHADHIGGFPDLFEHANIDELWYNGQAHTTWTFEQFLDAVESSDTGYEEPVRGDVISHGPLEIEVLHPAQTAADYDGPLHDYTLVVRVTYEDTSILFPGDAEHALESQLLAAAAPGQSPAAPGQSPAAPAPAPSDAARNDDLSNGNDTVQVPDRDEGQNITLSSDVLRLGHHGSDTSSSTGFLEEVAPEIVVYSAGRDNRYGHPHDEVLARVEQIGAQIYGTDVHGNVILRSDGERWHVETVPDTEIEGLCININRADTSALTDIIHIGPTRAEALEAMRPFESVEGLTRIPGIGEARIEDILDQGAACVE